MFQAPTIQEHIERYRALIIISLLIVFYTVGVVGLSLDSQRDDFLELSFFNLALSFGLLLLGRTQHSLKLYGFIFLAFTIGMSVEWIGVHTGFLFGNYRYGESLGFRLFDVPIIIGINWAMLVMISAAVAKTIPVSRWIQIILATAFMVILDVLIEPVAIKSDYWIWDGPIPFSNFIDWFLVTIILQAIYFRLNLAEVNKVAIALYFIQLVFFIILNI
jgi:bisanhydrobacterioruberin hydratase